MPYTAPPTYVDLPSTTTPILATHLNTAFSALAGVDVGKPDKSTLTGKGSLYVATAAGAVTELSTAGTTAGQVLTIDAAQTKGVKWAAPTATPNGYTALAYNATGQTQYVTVPTDSSSTGSMGGTYSITMTQDTYIRLLDSGLGEVANVVTLLLIQDAVGGRYAQFAPSTIHWVPNANAKFDVLDYNWDYYGLRAPGPIVDTTPGGRTICRFTWMGALGGWLGEVVAYIPPLYTSLPATWNNTVNSAGNPQTVYLPGGVMRGCTAQSRTNFLDAVTNPTWISAASRQRIASHGGTVWVSRVEPSDAPPISYSRGYATGAGLTIPSAACIADAGYGPTYPPSSPASPDIQGVMMHEYSHMEDGSYFTAGQPDPTYGSISVSAHTPVANNFNACFALGATPVGADPNNVTEWYAEMRRDARLGQFTRQLTHVGTGTSGASGLVTPQNRVDSFNNYINGLNGGAGLN